MNKLSIDFNRSQPLNLTTTTEDDLVQWCLALSFFARLVAYVATLALLVLIIFLILKYLAEFHNETTEEEAIANETNPLLRPAKTIPFTYGSCEIDLESGNCSSSGISNNSSEELYDGKICVICCDAERNCFLVPCGHCATCCDCAQRIFKGESRTCPVCRRLIGKVRRLFAA